ncbi:KH domain-containing protein HEN4 [Rhododendron vialii]|uniref:KH domain-containing protein HEN4 n=1 Tax=Rhododendron vialii TaxID=182163 RepID=UPI00265DDC9D|nr:KH domain-containing protein HEN4 [Rhododendron vialii]
MGETVFRILCPAGQTGGIVRNGGAFIRQVREETGARIRVEDSVPGCKERMIVIVSDKESTSKNIDASGDESMVGEDEEVSQGQQALVRVFERIAEERSGVSSTESEFEERDGGGGHNNIGGGGEGAVVCRLLAPSSQVGCVLGRGGRIVERIRHDSGARVRILQYDQIPPCAFPGDELIQITGNFSAVRKALLSVSSCLQVNSGANAVNSAATRSSGLAQHGTGTENIGPNHRLVVTEEEVVFRLLCQVDKIRSLIGKGGSILRVLQSETGASIKIADSAPDSDETLVVISAREHSEQRHSSAQDAVIRVHCRIAEIGFERGAAVVARLLVHSQQIGCLLGKGGSIINELRRVTGASIRVFQEEQVLRFGSENDEVVQVIGSLQSVQDALFRITSRLRQTIFAVKPHHAGVSGSQYLPPYSEMPPPMFRSRHDPGSPVHYPSPAILPRGVDRVPFPPQPLDPRPFSHDTDHVGPTYFDRMPYPYGSERPGHGPSFDWQPSPREWTYQAGSRGNPREVAEIGGGFAFSSVPIGSRNLAPNSASMTVEVVIPQTLLGHVYGENNGNLNQIRQISGAEVFVHDPRPGATEGVAVVSGMRDQLHAAQSLIHAFILAELPF